MTVNHRFLIDRPGTHTTKQITRQGAIRNKCLECSNFNTAMVRSCDIIDCALWPFRLPTGVDRTVEDSLRHPSNSDISNENTTPSRRKGRSRRGTDHE